MKTRLEKLIISLNFTEAKALVDSLNKVELENYMLELCYESENIIYYSFVFDMLKRRKLHSFTILLQLYYLNH
ncbi:hypothetical protein [Lysinibacillus sp. NPDC096396]|uniref:hypothetical protein n=1 Tax=unclassified Lysinibacillus TaxID=2636778 RepID=UPI0037F762CA